MFGTNEIIGKKQFRDAPSRTLKVTSIFYTLQGEGPFSGMPAVFVRLTHCNLSCQFCDTFFDDGDVLTYEKVEEKIHDTIAAYWTERDMNVPQWAINHEHPGAIHKGVVLVMTGGEPLIQENISQFMKEQLPRFKAVQVESNGIPETEVPEGVVLVCSPKCAEKNGVATQYFKPSKTILERADCLKFVMSADKLSPYNTIPQWAFDWKERTGKEIYCSPMNVYNTFPQKIKILRAEKGQITMAERSTVDEIISWWEKDLLDMSKNQANHEYVGQYCVDNGLRAQMQTHLFMSLA